MPIHEQADQVDRVKRSESGMISNPITILPDRPLSDVYDMMRKYSISGIPVTNQSGILIGIITNRDMMFEEDLTKKVEDIMTKDKLVTAPVGTTLDQAITILHRYRIEKLPVVDENFKLKPSKTSKKDSNTRILQKMPEEGSSLVQQSEPLETVLKDCRSLQKKMLM